MLPCALLFSSDEHTTRLLQPALAEVQVDVEHCTEILPAVEKITGHAFPLLILDWNQPLEAGFLLKTAREFQTSKTTFVLAIVQPKDANVALQAGVDAVLTRPLVLEQVKSTLLAARELVVPPVENAVPAQPGLEEAALPQTLDQAALEAPPDPPLPQPDQPLPRVEFGDPGALLFGGYVNEPVKKPWPQISFRKLGGVLAGLAAVAAVSFGAWRFAPLHWPVRSTRPVVPPAVQPAPWPVANNPRPGSGSPETGRAAASAPTQPWDAPWNEVPAREPTAVEVTPVLSPSQTDASKVDTPAAATQDSSPPSTDTPSPASSALLEPSQPETSASVQPVPAHSVVQAASSSSTIPDSLSRPLPGGQLVAPGPKLETAAVKWTAEPFFLPEDVSRALLVRAVAPGYPDRALQSGVQGAVVLQAFVGKDGSVRDLKLVRGYFVLAQAAIDAVKQWRYQPYRVNGEIVEMQTLVTVDFKHP